MRLIVEHLVRLGHRELACLAPPPDLLFTEHRLLGLRETWQRTAWIGENRSSLATLKSGFKQPGIS
jgi:DNA-binding LacI/PurR family transcriptional regulator